MLIKALDSAIDDQSRENVVTEEAWQPISARRADALAEIAESYLETGPACSSSADRYQVMVHVSEDTLSEDKPSESRVTAETSTSRNGEICQIENGPGISAETSKRLCCDASISVLREDKDGEPLNIGRKSRVIPAPMRRALFDDRPDH